MSAALFCLAVLLVVTLLGVPSAAASPAVPARVWVVDSLTKLFPGTPPGAASCAALDACRGEWESFQVVLRPARTLTAVTVSASALRGSEGTLPASRVDLYQEHFVRVEHPSGNAVAEPRQWPDALLPMRVVRSVKAPAGRNLAFWVTVRVPATARPGIYRGAITLSSGSARLAQVPVSLRVWDIALPATNHQGATAALYLHQVCDYLNKHYRRGRPPLAEGSPEWEALKERYWRFLLEYRICPYDLPVSVASPTAERFLRDERLACYRLPWAGDDGERFRAEIEALRRLGALSRGFYYQYDEPRMEQYADVRGLAERVRGADPSLRRLLTLFPTPDLYGSVEIWCPDIGDTFGPGYLDHDLLRERRRAGEETWWYTMCVPRYPYPTWLVDDDATAHRIFCWMQALYGITGFVYSQVNGWSEDPYQDVSSFAGSNGDGLLLYPGNPFGSSEPFPSIRLQVIRDALEDYECLWLLREESLRVLRQMGAADAEALAEGVVAGYCRRLVASERAFSRRPGDLARARRDLLDEILRCRERPWVVVALSGVLDSAGVEPAASGPTAEHLRGRRNPSPSEGPSAEGSEQRISYPLSTLILAAEPGSQVEVAGQPVALDATGWAVCALAALPVTITASKEGRTHTVVRWPLWPAETVPEPPRVTCPLLKSPPTLDGVISPGEWQGAATTGPALLANGLGAARARTECFIGRDAGHLYFAARCHLGNGGTSTPENGGVQAAGAQQDSGSPQPSDLPVSQSPQEQSIALILDPPPLGDGKLGLVMAGTGKRYATLRTRRGYATPRFGWRWAQRAGEGVWECEMLLAFGDLVPAPEAGAEWGINFERQCGAEQSTWALSFGDVRRLGRMGFAPEAP